MYTYVYIYILVFTNIYIYIYIYVYFKSMYVWRREKRKSSGSVCKEEILCVHV